MVFVLPSLLCPPPSLCTSPLVFCPGQFLCWFSDVPSTSLPLWLQLALYLALACLTELFLFQIRCSCLRETLLAHCIWWRTFTTTTLFSPHPAPISSWHTGHCRSYLLSLPSPQPLNVSLGDSVSSRNCSRRGSSTALSRISLEIK